MKVFSRFLNIVMESALWIFRGSSFHNLAAEVPKRRFPNRMDLFLYGTSDVNAVDRKDDITTEILVAAGGRELTEITNLANIMYSEGSFPEQMYTSIFIPIPKIKGTAKCEKHRTISLMSHATKLFLRVIMNRIRGRTVRLHAR